MRRLTLVEIRVLLDRAAKCDNPVVAEILKKKAKRLIATLPKPKRREKV